MKRVYVVRFIPIFLLLVILLVGCNKVFDYGELENAVETIGVEQVQPTSASITGRVILDRGSDVFERGICYGQNSNPTVSGPKKVDTNSGLGVFSSVIYNLSPNTLYYARTYATNSYGTAYGNSISFTTKPATVPILGQTTAATMITSTTARTGGSITNGGVSSVTSRGVCWSSTNSNPTISGSRTNDGTGTGNFTSNLSGLQPNTLYYIRAYATNSAGTGYGDVKTFTTSPATLPSGIATSTVSSVTQTTAIAGGNISSDGGSSIISRGICWSNFTTSPTISNSRTIDGSGVGSFSSTMTGLSPNTTYYVRAYATNAVGTTYGNVVSFTTLQSLSVGQSFQGGIIGHIFVPGDPGYIAGQTHGLIVSTVNQSIGVQWGCSGTSISGTSTSIGSGQNNTNLIVSSCVASTAASICNNLSSGGYSDWYLPSRDELGRLYSNRFLIGGFSNVSYWSSSQSSSTTAWSINFSTGTSNSTTTKTSLLYVRAVRLF